MKRLSVFFWAILVFGQATASHAAELKLTASDAFAILKVSYNRIGETPVTGGICGTAFFIDEYTALTANHVLNRLNYKPNDGYNLTPKATTSMLASTAPCSGTVRFRRAVSVCLGFRLVGGWFPFGAALMASTFFCFPRNRHSPSDAKGVCATPPLACVESTWLRYHHSSLSPFEERLKPSPPLPPHADKTDADGGRKRRAGDWVGCFIAVRVTFAFQLLHRSPAPPDNLHDDEKDCHRQIV